MEIQLHALLISAQDRGEWLPGLRTLIIQPAAQRYALEDNTKINLKRFRCGDLNWIQLNEAKKNGWLCEYGVWSSASIKSRKL
jgi:hypothetical protein